MNKEQERRIDDVCDFSMEVVEDMNRLGISPNMGIKIWKEGLHKYLGEQDRLDEFLSSSGIPEVNTKNPSLLEWDLHWPQWFLKVWRKFLKFQESPLGGPKSK